MTRSKNPFPGVNLTPIVDRHGKTRHRFRKKGIDCYLPGPYGSTAFRAAYDTAMEGARTPTVREGSLQGTLGWLIEQKLRHASYKYMAPSRKRSLRGELDWLRKQAGELPYGRLGVSHVEALMAMKAGPTAANTVRKNLSMLFNFAINKLEQKVSNPARGADRRAVNKDGYHTWTEAEISQFLAVHPPGTKARLALVIFLWTGASRADVSRMGWQNVKAGRIEYRRGKTGVLADLPIVPQLAEELSHVPRDQMLFLTHSRGQAYKPETLGNWFRDQCNAAGLPHCAAHGLRKAAATRIVNHGGNQYEVMSFLAHATPKEGSVYVKKASRSHLADSALSRISQPKHEHQLSNLSPELDKGEP